MNAAAARHLDTPAATPPASAPASTTSSTTGTTLPDLAEIERHAGSAARIAARANARAQRPLGAILREIKGLSDIQLASIERHQHTREPALRFGEAAIDLGLANQQDVLFALSQQFSYPYATEARRRLQPELVAAVQPFSRQAEAFRAIRSQLLLRTATATGDALPHHSVDTVAPDGPRQALAVLSPDSGDGKTFFTANLGVVLAQTGARVLVVDADLRGPRLHELFGLPNTAGLSSVLSGRKDKHLIHQAPDIPSLFVLPVGITPPNPLELIERPAFAQLLTDLVRKFDHVLVDTPALRHGSDGYAIAAKCGAALVIARRHHSRLDALQALVAGTRGTGVSVAGVVVNRF